MNFWIWQNPKVYFQLLYLVIIIVIAGGLSKDSHAKENSKTLSSRQNLFSPSVISKIGMDDKRLKSLPSKQRESLFQARDILVLFFKATQAKDKNISKFLGQNVLSRFPNRTVLLEKLLMYESDIDILSITKFDFEDENLILFNYYLVLFYDGNFQIQEDSVKIKKFGDFWKIISISSLD